MAIFNKKKTKVNRYIRLYNLFSRIWNPFSRIENPFSFVISNSISYQFPTDQQFERTNCVNQGNEFQPKRTKCVSTDPRERIAQFDKTSLHCNFLKISMSLDGLHTFTNCLLYNSILKSLTFSIFLLRVQKIKMMTGQRVVEQVDENVNSAMKCWTAMTRFQ